MRWLRYRWYRLRLLLRPGKTCVLLRGLPGSGKSTLAAEYPKDHVFSTDAFWGPNYDYDRERLREAHLWNQERARNAMAQGVTPVVIDNTNVTFGQMRAYVEMAVQYGYSVEFRETQTPWRFDAAELERRTVHGVPLEIIEQMLVSWQKEPTVEKVLQA
ncbi:MAG: ATP-binding protein [Armatimonadetes bacterium]|nr:ATP-binding protein [Armatimonadota bacterium]